MSILDAVPRRLFVLTLIIGLSVVHFARIAVAQDAQPVREIRVTRFSPSPDLKAHDVELILEAASRIFVKRDCPGDVACPITLRLERFTHRTHLGTFSSQQEEVQAHRDTDSLVLIVNRIDDAACSDRGGAGRILGCTGPANDWMAVVRYPPGIGAGIVWAHEYSHACGNGHREEKCALMRAYLYPDSKAVSKKECVAIRGALPVGTPAPAKKSAPKGKASTAP